MWEENGQAANRIARGLTWLLVIGFASAAGVSVITGDPTAVVAFVWPVILAVAFWVAPFAVASIVLFLCLFACQHLWAWLRGGR